MRKKRKPFWCVFFMFCEEICAAYTMGDDPPFGIGHVWLFYGFAESLQDFKNIVRLCAEEEGISTFIDLDLEVEV